MSTLKEHQAVLLELLEEFDRICKKHRISYSLFAGSALGAVRHGGFIPWDDDLDVVMLRSEYERFMQIAPDEVSSPYYVQREYSDKWPMHFSKLRKNNTTCLEKYHPKMPDTHQGIYIDIFPCDNLYDKPFMRKLQYYAARIVVARNLYIRGYETDNKFKKLFMAFCSILPHKFLHRFAVNKKQNNTKMLHTFFGGTSRYEKGIFPREWLAELQEIQFENLKVYVSKHSDALLTTLYGDYMTLPPEEERRCKVHAVLVDTEKPYTEYKDYRDGMMFDVYTRSIR